MKRRNQWNGDQFDQRLNKYGESASRTRYLKFKGAIPPKDNNKHLDNFSAVLDSNAFSVKLCYIGVENKILEADINKNLIIDPVPKRR